MYNLSYNDDGITVRSKNSFVKLEFLFQPIIELKRKKIKYLEVLSRVLNDSGEIYQSETFFSDMDDEFIKIVALAQIKFCEANEINIPVTINLTLSCLKDKAFLYKIVDVKDVIFNIEITELNTDVNCSQLQANMRFLKQYGIGFLLDDYYHKKNGANLSLGFIDWDYIKIDKLFLYHNYEDSKSLTYLLSVISPYSKKGLILEGVETACQHDIVKDLNTLVQGYFYSYPMSWGKISKKFGITKNNQNV
ncbi:EAL domain-containing protein [Vibrio atlanticus]|uniref:EAL domain-containing protein n=1 Tax=Vibrio atlanticus TaxID=693153 RepID=UPI0022B00D78|nr:EAL domain-containing protein [Vibrio atlanticus]MCZ4307459.1 EAL domain-containing protein [Vibrio atlanticus]